MLQRLSQDDLPLQAREWSPSDEEASSPESDHHSHSTAAAPPGTVLEALEDHPPQQPQPKQFPVAAEARLECNADASQIRSRSTSLPLVTTGPERPEPRSLGASITQPPSTMLPQQQPCQQLTLLQMMGIEVVVSPVPHMHVVARLFQQTHGEYKCEHFALGGNYQLLTHRRILRWYLE